MKYIKNERLFINDDNQEIDLTPKEGELLEALINNKVATENVLLEQVYREEVENFDYCVKEKYFRDMMMQCCRSAKFRLCQRTGIKVKTIRNIGYKLMDEIELIES